MSTCCSLDSMHEWWVMGFIASFPILFLGNTGVAVYHSVTIDKPYGDSHGYHKLKNATHGFVFGACWGLIKGISYSLPWMIFWPYAILEHIYGDMRNINGSEKLRPSDIRFHFVPGSNKFQYQVRIDGNLRDYDDDLIMYRKLGIVKSRT